MKKLFSFALILVLSFSFLVQPAMAASTTVSVKTLGAKGDGKTDDTAAIQTALSKYDNITIPDGVYMINPDKSLRTKSNQTVTLSSGAVLQALPSRNSTYYVLLVSGVHDITITGGKIIGERYSHLGTTGEWGMGLKICNGSSNINVSNMTISNCWGDGLYIGDNALVNTVKIDHVIADSNRRQGLSITNATNVMVSNSVFRNTNGTDPQSGIDIEPNAGNAVTFVTFTNVECYGNKGRGLSLSGFKGIVSDITVSSCSLHDNGTAGIFIETAKKLAFTDTKCTGNDLGITILANTSTAQFTNMTVSQNRRYGFSIDGNRQTTGIDGVYFTNSSFYDNSQSQTSRYDGALIYSDLTGYIRNIAFSGCKFYDDQANHTQRYGLNVATTTNVSNITMNNCTYGGNIAGDYSGILAFTS